MLSILEELDLSNNKLPIKEMENFTSSLGSTPRLKTLKLSMCGLTKDSLSILGTKAMIKSFKIYLQWQTNITIGNIATKYKQMQTLISLITE